MKVDIEAAKLMFQDKLVEVELLNRIFTNVSLRFFKGTTSVEGRVDNKMVFLITEDLFLKLVNDVKVKTIK